MNREKDTVLWSLGGESMVSLRKIGSLTDSNEAMRLYKSLTVARVSQ